METPFGVRRIYQPFQDLNLNVRNKSLATEGLRFARFLLAKIPNRFRGHHAQFRSQIAID